MGGSLEDLVKRFHDLEVSQAELRDQLQWMLGEGREGHAHGMRPREGGDVGLFLPGRFSHGSYRSVLKHVGHALHIYRPHTGEIIFWNQSAENLYGWTEDEAVGKRVGDLLMNEERIPYLGKIMDRLRRGQSWSGQLAFVKKSGETFMAMVTKSPLYEDGAFVGVITVSSDAALLDDDRSEMLRGCQDQAPGPARTCTRVRWRRPPPIASSVSNLASKVFSRNRACGDTEHDESWQFGDESGKKELAAPETLLVMHARKRGIEDNS
ncbi:PAS fold [Musa troglodytarum]|uniref:PAS fold n=1 Tax=Musa troglodytarum TaxID=320322 RepID=A0A9E7JL06_9LILI|nr:PAS fold [Musa troglodytarum]